MAIAVRLSIRIIGGGKDVYKRQDKPVLLNINMKIETGEFIILIGSSGCGKTTLLKTINKLNPLDRGDILIDGVSIKKIPDNKLRRSKMCIRDRSLIVVVLIISPSCQCFSPINAQPIREAKKSISLLPVSSICETSYGPQYNTCLLYTSRCV